MNYTGVIHSLPSFPLLSQQRHRVRGHDSAMSTEATGSRILVVDDESNISDLIATSLKFVGFDVRTAASGSQALAVAEEFKPHAMILDVMLPDLDGFEVCREIRKVSTVPIIMLTARISEADRVTGYESGADIYLSKPVSVAELEASISSIARRQVDSSSHENELWLDVISMRLQKGSQFTELTRQETQLLRALNEAPMQFLPAWALLERLGKDTDSKSRSNLDVSITRLRKKLLSATGQDGTLKVARNAGYQLTIRLRMK